MKLAKTGQKTDNEGVHWVHYVHNDLEAVLNTIGTTKARSDFAEIVNRVAYGRERIVLERRGKRIVALVPIEDLDLLEALEDQMDVEAARKALVEDEFIDYEEARKELGLK